MTMNSNYLFVFAILNVLNSVPIYSTEKIIEQEVKGSMESYRNYNPEQDYRYFKVKDEVTAIQSSKEHIDYEERFKRVMNCGLECDPEDDCIVMVRQFL